MLLTGYRDNCRKSDYTQYQKAPTFAVSCESLEQHSYRKGAPFDIACNQNRDFATISVFLASAQSSAYPAPEANLPIVAEPEPTGTPGRPNVIGRYVDVEGGMKNEVQTTATHGR